MVFGFALAASVFSLHAESTWEMKAVSAAPDGKAGHGVLTLEVADADTGEGLPFKTILEGAEGKFLDGSGRGLYEDGRFFAEGSTMVEAPAGRVAVSVARGPEYHPIAFDLEVKEGQAVVVAVKLKRWISLVKRGWYGGDNHVHTRHDQHAPIRTDLGYAALQARAQGLNFLTEAGSTDISYDPLDRLDDREFVIRHCGEIRPGAFVGHYNPVGLFEPLPSALYEDLIHRPLPGQGLYEAVRERGGLLIHTHPFIPRHQLHWMGAFQAWPDAVSGQAADLLDVDGRLAERLWFALLNLGNRIAVSGSTDAALGRTRTATPGDHRIYCRAGALDYDQFLTAMKEGRTMATNGGPLFAFFSVDGLQVGDEGEGRERVTVHLDVESLAAVREAAVYLNGRRVVAFDPKGQKGSLSFERQIALPQDGESWLVARVQDEKGKWCLTNPIRFQAPDGSTADGPAPSSILFQINNATRFADLSPDYFGHVLVTVRDPERLERLEVRLSEGGEGTEAPFETVAVYEPGQGDQLSEAGKIPVTGLWGAYQPGVIWHPEASSPWHVQADFKVTRTGWYRVHATTSTGRTLHSSAMHFDAENPKSQSLSVASLEGPETALRLWGYGTDIEVAKLHPTLNKGSWWYPGDIYWRLQAVFGGEEQVLGWPTEQPVERFRE